jgi:hypothetical protein
VRFGVIVDIEPADRVGREAVHGWVGLDRTFEELDKPLDQTRPSKLRSEVGSETLMPLQNAWEDGL